MKKHLLALAALATVSGVAAAQSVTVYGIIDTSITTSSKGTTNNSSLVETSAGSKTSLTSAVWLPSVYGVTGSEDLGGGLKATFQLEGDLDSDTGTNTGSKLFRRISTVGLSSGTYGTVKLGKQIDPLFLQSFLNNVRLAHSASLAVQGQLSYGAKGAGTTGSAADLGVFIDNAVSYTTPTFNGFNLQAFHAFGETAGKTSAGATDAFLLTGKVGDVALSAAYEEIKSSTGAKQLEKTLFGAVYTIGALQLNAGVNTFKSKSGTAIDANGYELGAGYAITPALTAAVNYVKFDDKANHVKPTTSSASLKYALSKRTSVWGLVSEADPKGNTTGVTIPVSSFYNQFNMNGVKQTGYAVGVTHTF
jgi:predicted porin